MPKIACLSWQPLNCNLSRRRASHGDGGPVPVEVRPHVSAALAAGRANEARLDIGQPDIIGPAIAADGDRMTAAKVPAINEDPAHAHVAHFGEGDTIGHLPKFGEIGANVKPPVGSFECLPFCTPSIAAYGVEVDK